MWQEAILE